MNNRNIHDLLDATAYDNAGEKLGGVKEVFVNDETGQPDFVEVGHGLFGMSSSLVPLRGHRWDGEDLHLAFSKEAIKDAPNIDTDAHISDSEQATIYRHYSLDTVENTQNYEPDYRRNEDRELINREHEAEHDHLENRAKHTDAAAGGAAAGAAYANETHGGQTDRVELNDDGEPAFDQRAGIHQTAPGEHHVVDHRGDRYEGHESPAVGGAGQPAAITPEQEAQAQAQRSESSYTQHDPADAPMEHTLPSDDHGAAAATAGIAGAGGAGLAADAAYGDDRANFREEDAVAAGEPDEIHVHHTYDNAGADTSGAAHDSVSQEETIAERNNLPDEEKTIDEERAAEEGMIRFHRFERRTDIDPSLR